MWLAYINDFFAKYGALTIIAVIAIVIAIEST